MHKYNERFLFEGLIAANVEPEDEGYDENYELRHYSSPDLAKVFKPGWFYDTDMGGPRVWIASHKRSNSEHFINGRWHDILREWGYVMWDESQLRTLELPWAI
jgi:hypothetical protein